jgi:hypothetical protein
MRPFAVSHTSSKATLSCGVTEGDQIDLTLLERSSDSALAFPLSDTWPLPPNVICNYVKPDTPLIPWHFTPSAMTFARFMLATPEYLEAEFTRDVVELNDAMTEAESWGSVQELPYMESSIEKIQSKIKVLRMQKTKELELTIQTSEMMFEAVAKYNKKHGKTVNQQLDAPDEHHVAHQPVRSNKPTSDFYFYQAIDGQHVYLHPLDIRILKHEFGEYEHFPEKLQVQATAVQESTLTEDLRKKCKYLGHLPLACDVTFLEINVKDLVSAETVQVYQRK